MGKDKKDKELKKELKKIRKELIEIEDLDELEATDEPGYRYNKALKLYNNMSCMTVTKSRIEVYQDLQKQFEELGDYEDAKQYSEKCAKSAIETENEYIALEYQKNQERMKEAKSYEEYEELLQSYTEMGDYKDAKEKLEECKKALNKYNRKQTFRRIRFVAFIVLIVGLFAFSKTRMGRYTVARGLQKLTIYNKSAEMYKDLGKYKDSKKRYQACVYHQAKNLKTKNKEKARELFYEINSYKDSAKELVELENEELKQAVVGDLVMLGRFRWLVLQKDEEKVLLMKNAPLRKIPYHSVNEEITWENSEIRQYLNQTFLEKYMCEEEVKRIIKVQTENADNSMFGTTGGVDTLDSVFLFSESEVSQYSKIMTETGKKRFWLRTPGGMNCSAEIFEAGTVNQYGTLVDSDRISTYPVLWYSIEE